MNIYTRVAELEQDYIDQYRKYALTLPKGSHRNGYATPKHIRAPIFIENAKEAVNLKIQFLSKTIGTKDKPLGNKRIGRQRYYADLINEFYKLKIAKITLPKNHLSVLACTDSLISILYAHNKIPSTLISKKIFNNQERQMIFKSNEPAFVRVINTLNEN